MQRIWVVPDVHVPYHDKKAWALALQVLRSYPADVLVVIGDFLDLYCMSDYLADPNRPNNLLKEVRHGSAMLKELRNTVKHNGRAIYCIGNHEERLVKRVRDKLPALEGSIGLNTILDLSKWETVAYGKALRIGKVWFSHDFGAAGSNAGRATLLAVGDNCVFGHSHRGGTTYGGTALGTKHVALNVGWLGDPKHAEYMSDTAKNRDWIHGLGHILMEKNGVAHAQFVPFLNGRAVVDGTLIRV